MTLRTILAMATSCLLATATISAAETAADRSKLEKIQKRSNSKMEKIRKKSNKKMEKIREKANKRMSKILEKAWGKNEPPTIRDFEKIDPVVPVKPKDDEVLPTPIDNEIEVTPVDPPVVQPQPVPDPIVPIFDEEEEEEEEEVVAPTPKPAPKMDVRLYSTTISLPSVPTFRLADVSDRATSSAWDRLGSSDDYDRLANGVAAASRDYNLVGWGALNLTDAVASKLTADKSSHAFLQTWLMVQLGYECRLALSNGVLYLTFATDQIPYQTHDRRFMYLNTDGHNYVFYDKDYPGGSFYMHNSLSAGLKPVDLFITSLPRLSGTRGTRTLTSKTQPAESLTAATSYERELDFFESYPRFSYPNGGVVAQWVNYAQTPLAPEIKASLVAPLKERVKGMSELDAVNYILGMIQNSFPYGKDIETCGVEDRAFFPHETLYYPKSDCEDHAILFTRVIKDVLGLPVALVFYPGHLAAAVEFSTPQTGDYITVNGHRMTICDPTYYRPAGYTMPNMDNSRAQALRF